MASPTVNVPAGTPFETALLRLLGAPETPANYRFLNQWQLREHGDYKLYANNPFFTTAGAGGAARDFPAGQFPSIPNTPGVAVYPDVNVGTVATERTLEQYPAIVTALKSGNPAAYAGNPSFTSELRKWSGGGYGDIASIQAPATPMGPVLVTPLEGAAPVGDIIQGAGGAIAGVAGKIPGVSAVTGAAGDVAGAVGSIGDALSFVFSYRFLEILGGLALIGIGVIGLMKEAGVTPPVGGAAGAAASAIP